MAEIIRSQGSGSSSSNISANIAGSIAKMSQIKTGPTPDIIKYGTPAPPHDRIKPHPEPIIRIEPIGPKPTPMPIIQPNPTPGPTPSPNTGPIMHIQPVYPGPKIQPMPAPKPQSWQVGIQPPVQAMPYNPNITQPQRINLVQPERLPNQRITTGGILGRPIRR